MFIVKIVIIIVVENASKLELHTKRVTKRNMNQKLCKYSKLYLFHKPKLLLW